ncbi:hypothetical protein JOB18_048059 [Solea senegalensis]|uniref:Microtubule-associated protein 9 n=1 Tax=Solea senegalensis TaxID=28829 RepID=A0AAV6QC81_SOLSE|nr:microtubule-associated protein 9 [Solea senegalensis]KAG7487166.1 hypothetical protein JOB18_048059 [Solea senegalensis]
MTDQEFGTLAYTKSPKTSKRTTFQDELQAAVSARASKSKTPLYSYSDDFDEDEDDFFNKLLKSRKEKTDAFKAGKSRAKINDFDLSDDEGKLQKTKKVSFLKTQRISFPSENTSVSHENEPPESPISGHDNNNSSSSLQSSSNSIKHDTGYKNSVGEPVDPQILRENSNKSLSHQTSEDTLLDLPLSLPSDSRETETPGPEEKTPHLSAEPPRPKPRQRTRGLSFHIAEKLVEGAETQELSSRPQTSSASIPLSTDASSTAAVRSCSPHWTEDDHPISHSLSKSSSDQSEQSQLFTKSTVDSGSIADFTPDDNKEQERKYSTSFEEFHECSVPQFSHTQEKSTDTRSSSSLSKATQRSRSAYPRKVESKYLGTLKVLDHKVSFRENQPQIANSLRAAIYQEWLHKKKEKSKEKMQLKKKEEILHEKKKKDEEAAKKEDAAVSYEAWKEKKKGSLQAKFKEKRDMMRKEQQASEDKEEKRQSAKQVFENWKQENDHLLQEKYRKRKEAENKLKLKKQQKEEERKRECVSAYSKWCEKKTDVLHEKATKERKEVKDKTAEERYMKEERDKTALDTYENWLARKDLEHKRQREERQIKEILRDSPPPPWSPPNKTVAFGK